MKKIFNLAYVGAIALVCAGFSSCADDTIGKEVEPNPTYDAETGEVPVNFVFNVSTESAGTRMSANTVQVSDGSFRGIQDAVLLSFKMPNDGQYITDPTTAYDKFSDLNALVNANYLKPEKNETESSHRILEMSLPVNTNSLMMWGRAVKDPFKNAEQGNITFNPISDLTTGINGLTFTTNYCLSDDEKLAIAEYEELISTVFNLIVQKEVTSTIVNKKIKWSDYVKFNTDGSLELKTYDPSTYNQDLDPITNNALMSPLGAILGNLFITFNTYRTAGGQEELRNAEGAIIAYMMKDLDTVLSSVTNASPTTTQESVAKEVATAVKSEIQQFFGFAGTEPAWKDVNTVKTNAGKASLTRVTANLQGFPHVIFHLPPGATIMKYTSVALQGNSTTIVNAYSFMSSVPTYAMGAGDSFNPNNYIYPAELCYFGNSSLRVTNEERTESQYPNGTNNWVDDANWTSGSWEKDKHVLSSTRSVAMKDNINYGTSMLVTKVALKTGVTTFYDNNGGIHSGEAANEFTPTEITNGISLTGVLIGGQVKEVGWNYVAKGTPTFSYMVYDDQIPSGTLPTTLTPNYTMVWDNWNAANKGGDQNKVYVALQFKNETGKDFWGMHNLIRNKATFYLIGELDPDKLPAGFVIPAGEEGAGTTLTDTPANQTLFKGKKSWGITWPTNYALPPYNTDGSTIKERRVFIQDYQTVANFVIGQKSLQSALVSVPDLRSSQLSLGLSVDLQWRNGLNFNEVVLGE